MKLEEIKRLKDNFDKLSSEFARGVVFACDELLEGIEESTETKDNKDVKR